MSRLTQYVLFGWRKGRGGETGNIISSFCSLRFMKCKHEVTWLFDFPLTVVSFCGDLFQRHPVWPSLGCGAEKLTILDSCLCNFVCLLLFLAALMFSLNMSWFS